MSESPLGSRFSSSKNPMSSGDSSNFQRYVGIGSALSLIPIAAILFYLNNRIPPVPLILTGILAVCLLINIYMAYNNTLVYWPSRLGTCSIILNVSYGFFEYEYVHTLYWTLCLPPALIFAYGRKEGLFWTTALFVPTLAYLYIELPIAEQASVAINYVLAFTLTCMLAYAFHRAYSTAVTAMLDRGQKLAQEEERFRAFARIASDVLFEFDSRLHFSFVSSALLPTKENESSKLLGQHASAVFPFIIDEDLDQVRHLISMVEARETIKHQRLGLNIGGHSVTVDLDIEPKYEAGEFTGHRGIVRDVTESVARELEIRDKDRALYNAQKMEAVGQLTSGVAHDFNNLLTVIIGNLDLLHERGTNLSEDEQWNAIKAATDRANELTSKLLTFARKQPLRSDSIDASTLVQEMVGFMQRALGESIQISIQCQQDLWPILVDPAQLESALLNLAINSRDAMPNGGSLQITLKNESIIEHDFLGQGDFVCIEITDTGQGIDDNLVDRVFEPFFSTKPSDRGSGLGLSMVFGFTRQSGGDVRITSQRDVGTTVTLLLPRGTSIPERVQTPALDQTYFDGKKHRILIVEDDSSVREILATLLGSMGHEVIAQNSAVAGEAYVAEHKIDLLITDIVLANGENGIQLAKSIRALAPDLPILFISGYARMLENAATLLDNHMQLLSKPFGKSELQKALHGDWMSAAN